jgi:uncharacterized Zn-binding protein involved in type VI secretion
LAGAILSCDSRSLQRSIITGKNLTMLDGEFRALTGDRMPRGQNMAAAQRGFAWCRFET